MNIIDLEDPIGVITSLGGQTAINLAEPLHRRGVKIIGTSEEFSDDIYIQKLIIDIYLK